MCRAARKQRSRFRRLQRWYDICFIGGVRASTLLAKTQWLYGSAIGGAAGKSRT